MGAIHQTLARLEQQTASDRRLDAEITAWALAPPQWNIDPIEDIDGFAIEGSPQGDREAQVWMCAADVPYVTRYIDAAVELISMSCPHAAASICANASHSLAAPGPSETGEEFAGRTARWLVLGLLWSTPLEHGVGAMARPRAPARLPAVFRAQGCKTRPDGIWRPSASISPSADLTSANPAARAASAVEAPTANTGQARRCVQAAKA